MATRVISSTLKNLKFMQRAAQKEEKPNKEVEETKQDGIFVSSSNVHRKCVVIMEGDPHPGTVRGRMSFQNFNPSIDKLNGVTVDGDEAEAEASTSSAFQTGRNLGGENGASEDTDINMGNNDADGKLKRKHPEETSHNKHPKKLQEDCLGNSNNQPTTSKNNSRKNKRDKLDYNVLVPSKSQSKRRGG